MMQHYLIEVQLDERTRLKLGEDRLCQELEVILGVFFKARSTGPEPAVAIKVLKQNQEIITWKK